MQTILDFSEVWATLIPMLILILKKSERGALFPVVIYFHIALIVNIVIDLAGFKLYNNNNFVYNILSIVRLYYFIWFFKMLKIPFNRVWHYLIIVGTAIFFIFNFIYLEPFKDFSSRTFTVEGIVLIALCLLYFLRKMRSDEITYEFDACLFIVTGLAIYEVVSFPIFLFYKTLMDTTKDYAVNIWDIHNLVYIVFCFFIAKAFYGTAKHAKQ